MEHLNEEVCAALRTDLTIDITTVGRHSGKPRRIEIWFLHIDGRIFITGTPRPRDWLANLQAEPRFEFHLKESIKADLRATATVVTDLEQRRTVLSHEVASWYRGQAPLDELIAQAPMVEVTFD